MDHQPAGPAAEQNATLLRLTLHLRDAAADADRQDVITKVDELMSLIAGEEVSPVAGPKNSGPGVTENVQRILNGLGF